MTPPLRHMAYSMCKAAQDLEQAENVTLGRLWGAFIAIVTMEFGDRMEVRHERESVELVGQVAAEVEAKAPANLSAKAIEPILKRGLTEGTAPYGWFTKAYSNRRIELVKATEPK